MRVQVSFANGMRIATYPLGANGRFSRVKSIQLQKEVLLCGN